MTFSARECAKNVIFACTFGFADYIWQRKLSALLKGIKEIGVIEERSDLENIEEMKDIADGKAVSIRNVFNNSNVLNFFNEHFYAKHGYFRGFKFRCV